jgi:hypothetical protein
VPDDLLRRARSRAGLRISEIAGDLDSRHQDLAEEALVVGVSVTLRNPFVDKGIVRVVVLGQAILAEAEHPQIVDASVHDVEGCQQQGRPAQSRSIAFPGRHVVIVGLIDVAPSSSLPTSGSSAVKDTSVRLGWRTRSATAASLDRVASWSVKGNSSSPIATSWPFPAVPSRASFTWMPARVPTSARPGLSDC